MMRDNNPTPIRKSPTLKSQRSIQLPLSVPPSPTATKPLPVIEFPTSPERIVGEELLHFSHPQHPLSHINLPHLFTCSGCQEFGAAKRYACRLCNNYQLHEFCALAPQALKSHPLHYQHQLVFYSKPVKSGKAKSKCDACGEPVKGFSFRCNACNFQIHPCCAMLPLEIVFTPHPHTLKLLMASPNGGGDTSYQCGECKRRQPGRIYRCAVCDYHLHAICAKIIFNGLLDCGIKDPGKSGNVLEAAVRVASQVVTGFLGDLVKGIGEGVGQDIVQNVIAGTGNAFVSRGIAGK